MIRHALSGEVAKNLDPVWVTVCSVFWQAWSGVLSYITSRPHILLISQTPLDVLQNLLFLQRHNDSRSLLIIFPYIRAYNFPCLLKFPQTKGTTSRKVVSLTWLRGLYFIVVQGRGKPQKTRKSGLRFFLCKTHP